MEARRTAKPAPEARRDPRWARHALDLNGQEGLPAPLGATALGEGRCRFVVWAPSVERVEVRLTGESGRTLELRPDRRGYFHGEVEGVDPAARYLYRLDGGRERPDPASRYQPDGVHGPSEVVDTSFRWTDDGWAGRSLENLVLYEVHVGAYTAEGTFDALVPHLEGLRDLGITAVELMPLAQFPGDRNWGYDGAYPFAVQNSYGGPRALQRLVDACHGLGLAVVLDVVHNHFGPEGTYLSEFGPYFTQRYHTPWGDGVNFDGPHSDEVRRFFLESLLYFASEFHVDGFRLDATDTILDSSPVPFLAELARVVDAFGNARDRRVHLVAEDDRNAAWLVESSERGGYGLDGEWNDDFHHALHAVLTGDRSGYYQDFEGLEDLEAAFRDGYVYRGQRSAYRSRRQGTDARHLAGKRLVIFSQNHDQVGNRADPRRLAELSSPAGGRLAAAAVLLAPYVPLLFMGEEYGDPAPFPYFTSHSDPELIEAVRRGRREEFVSFAWGVEPPDPQSLATFESARLDHSLKAEGRHAALLEYYRLLLRLRREIPALSRPRRDGATTTKEGDLLCLLRRDGTSAAFAIWNFAHRPVEGAVELPPGHWSKRLDSSDAVWGGPEGGPPDEVVSEGRVHVRLPALTVALYERTTAR